MDDITFYPLVEPACQSLPTVSVSTARQRAYRRGPPPSLPVLLWGMGLLAAVGYSLWRGPNS